MEQDWHFDAKARPRPKGGGLLPVRVRTFLYDVGDVNLAERKFRADFYMVFTWKGPEPQLRDRDSETKIAWWPKFEVMNATAGMEAPRTEMLKYGSKTSDEYRYTVRYTGEFKILLAAERLTSFPFDTQYLVMDMSFWDTIDLIALVVNPVHQLSSRGAAASNEELFVHECHSAPDDDNHANDALAIARGVTVDEWDLYERLCNVRTFCHKYDTRMWDTHPRLQIEIPLRRYYKYHVMKFVSVAVLCNAIDGSVFWIPIKDISSRTDISITLFLSLVAFQLVVTGELPKATWTLIDNFFMQASIFVTSVLIEGIIAGAVYKDLVLNDDTDGEAMQRLLLIDYAVFWTYVALNAVSLLHFGWKCWREAVGWYLEPPEERPLVDKFYNLTRRTWRSSRDPEEHRMPPPKQWKRRDTLQRRVYHHQLSKVEEDPLLDDAPGAGSSHARLPTN
mmetsp:Transcript_83598/g.215292  ORF Transcript_83598/g.215292 Transcript_83598/m.215292 type:complete len:449 (-) Transcript_83598:58-1404(-)